ncbi:MAG: CapA family protein [Alistipes sp.]|nr:CapA family protein [Alistipes sp.]
MVWCAVALLVSCGDAGCGSVCDHLGDEEQMLLADREQSSLPTTPSTQRVRLLFAGDAMCHSPQITAAYRVNGLLDFKSSFAAVKPYFDRADIAVVNLETTISANSQYSGYPTFSSPAEYAEALAWAGMDVALLANNHCCDRGARGIRSSVAALNRLGVAHTGAFADQEDYDKNSILRFERGGIRFALVNYTYGTNGIPVPSDCRVNMIDTLRMAEDLARARVDADCLVACLHWGEEYRRQPSREQRALAEFMHRHGVDILVGSHPHVVQPALTDGESVTIYSLGNFVSNQRKRYCDGGIMAEVEVEKRSDGSLRYSLCVTPVWVSVPGYRILPPEVAAKMIGKGQQRADYEQFMYDTERLFVEGLKPL